MENRIFNDVVENRNGHYCHALELSSAYALECVIDEFISTEGEKYTMEEYIEFFNTMSIYYLPWEGEEENNANEEELYNVNIKETIEELY